ncbi:MAG: hypothetical protein IIY31_05220, partial [Desulfovibrio sp.]|nr:hypothetical protein [Desulfovibrio sp.]
NDVGQDSRRRGDDRTAAASQCRPGSRRQAGSRTAGRKADAADDARRQADAATSEARRQADAATDEAGRKARSDGQAGRQADSKASRQADSKAGASEDRQGNKAHRPEDTIDLRRLTKTINQNTKKKGTTKWKS